MPEETRTMPIGTAGTNGDVDDLIFYCTGEWQVSDR